MPEIETNEEIHEVIMDLSRKVQRQMDRVLIHVLNSAWFYIENRMKAEDTAWPMAYPTRGGYEVKIEDDDGEILDYCTITTDFSTGNNLNSGQTMKVGVRAKFYKEEFFE